MKRWQKFLLTATSCFLLVNLVVGYRVYSREADRTGEQEAFEKISVMMRVLHLIRQDYVDPDKIDFKRLIYGALQGMVSSLDPFSSFMPPDEYKDMMQSTEGEFGGLGVVVTVRDGFLTVVAPISGTPGSLAGLRAGDQIIKIEQRSTENMDLQQAVKQLKGPPGTPVQITIRRPSTGEVRDLTIVRAVIRVPSVKDVRILDGNIGYIRITQFNDPTPERLEKALVELSRGRRLNGLVIDLRNNPGGLLDAAVQACGLFLPAKSLVVYTEGRRPSQKREYFTTRKGKKFMDVKIAILVNRGSASAAEIMSACLQDYHRAVLVGERTFGKGTVQNVMELPDGSALRLTVAKYYTPSRRVIHHHGIEPDIKVKLSDEEFGKLIDAQSAVGAEKDKVQFEDRQLERAVETLKSYQAFLKGRADRFRGKDLPKAPKSVQPAAKPGKQGK
ncbi:MAG: S41 family peptidase [Kiritimatiellaeota bacterium]|nr:S41 family peptidase [Kiritimatiellota bacterium]